MPRRRAPTKQQEPLTEAGAWGRLLNWFSARPRTERETARRLARWGLEPEVRELLMQRLRDVGLLDDRAFADAYARELRGKGFRGPALSAKLAAKGVEGAVADALGHDSGDETDDTALLAIAMRRIRALPADEGAALRRLTGYLARRGVSAGRAFEIAKQALGQRL